MVKFRKNSIHNLIKGNNNENKTKSTAINSVLKAIPIIMENLTSPSLYSFFHGLKNVFTIRGSEKALKNDLFRFKKYPKRRTGASKYQNLSMSTGSFHMRIVYH